MEAATGTSTEREEEQTSGSDDLSSLQEILQA